MMRGWKFSRSYWIKEQEKGYSVEWVPRGRGPWFVSYEVGWVGWEQVVWC